MIRRPASPHEPIVQTALALPEQQRTAVAPRSDVRITAVVREHHAFIWRLVRRLGVAQATVDDVTQKVFVIAARRIDDIALGSERAFLFGTAVRVASDERSLALHGQQSDDGAEEMADPAPSAEHLVDRKRARQLLDDVLTSMPMQLRTAFVLFELEQMTKTEVARLLDVPVGTAVSRLRKAREEFKQRVARRLRRRPLPKVTP
jgi:RNA polymerase sigma-70 factor (ECF subfamily)